MDQTQVDPLKVIGKLREKLNSKELSESVLQVMLDDANGLLMQLRTKLSETEEALADSQEAVTSITADYTELDEENKRLRTTLQDNGIS